MDEKLLEQAKESIIEHISTNWRDIGLSARSSMGFTNKYGTVTKIINDSTIEEKENGIFVLTLPDNLRQYEIELLLDYELLLDDEYTVDYYVEYDDFGNEIDKEIPVTIEGISASAIVVTMFETSIPFGKGREFVIDTNTRTIKSENVDSIVDSLIDPSELYIEDVDDYDLHDYYIHSVIEIESHDFNDVVEEVVTDNAKISKSLDSSNETLSLEGMFTQF